VQCQARDQASGPPPGAILKAGHLAGAERGAPPQAVVADVIAVDRIIPAPVGVDQNPGNDPRHWATAKLHATHRTARPDAGDAAARRPGRAASEVAGAARASGALAPRRSGRDPGRRARSSRRSARLATARDAHGCAGHRHGYHQNALEQPSELQVIQVPSPDFSRAG
jgi:hypothetical protein